ncbi:type II toxin-antitoxin system VapC family toxin [Stenomitos frigidus]|uniref:Nucleic acid-binding protein n=1 Tax=Stenomitos frigidus ULC18 TaxID=2107698 RepID=A0A2T1DZW5_9CYAN|nr:PIN domain-containing protein [Stenomitos frigidus]PSB26038.1 nucleic acid-binding protein [Stenomitos frigidus ULC18]
MQTDSSIFIDTWGWLALGHRADNYHQTVKEIYQHLRQTQAQMHTSDYVLDELISLLFGRELFQEATGFVEGIFAATELGQLQIHRVTSQHFAQAWGLRKRFQDKPLISFTDLTSMVMMQEQGILSVLTQDDHFLQIGMGFVKVP